MRMPYAEVMPHDSLPWQDLGPKTTSANERCRMTPCQLLIVLTWMVMKVEMMMELLESQNKLPEEPGPKFQ